MKTWARTLITTLLLTCAGYASYSTAAAQQRPAATPAAVGISSERLERLHQGMQALVDRHEAGGIVTLIARDGKVVDVHASGFQDVESRTPMKTDTIFRIASMSKPITSVAVMML
jgi:CubicO group peptidase (beta-lactamase class C family)